MRWPLLLTLLATSAPAVPVNDAIRHYVRANSDGSKAENVVHFRPSRDRVAVYKWVEKCETAAYVTAGLDRQRWEPRQLIAGKVAPDGGQTVFGRIDADLKARRLTLAIDQPGQAIRKQLTVPAGMPWFLFDYDLADFNSWLQERRPVRAFDFFWALVWPEGDELLMPLARVRALPMGLEMRHGVETRRFDLTLAKPRLGRGTLWLDPASGAIIEAYVSLPNHPGMKDFSLKLQRVDTGGRAAWQRLLRGHYAGCAKPS